MKIAGKFFSKTISITTLLLLFLLLAVSLRRSGAMLPIPATTIPATLQADPGYCADDTVLAVIGDYGNGSSAEAAVAAMIDSWMVDFIVTTGDNNYPFGSATTIDAHIGRYFAGYIAPYNGVYGPGANENRFFPAPGNHDWLAADLTPYRAYFTLPHNERYYQVRRGAVEIFILDSDRREPDGISADSIQGRWLQGALAASNAPWKLVFLHHPPYSSGYHGSTPPLQWPFAAWGATAVVAGHDHLYERLHVDNITYFVNGLGGADRYLFGPPLPQSSVRYNDDFGAMKISISSICIRFQFFSISGQEIDRMTLIDPSVLPQKQYLPHIHSRRLP